MARFMVFVKGDERSEAGILPTPEQFEAMNQFNEELVKNGVMLAGEGLHPTSKGAKVRIQRGQVSVIDGPFTEAKEIVAGFWLWQCRSLDEAIEWVKRIPFEDFGENLPESVKESEARLREEVARQQGA